MRENTHAGFWSRGGQSDLSIDCNQQRPAEGTRGQASYLDDQALKDTMLTIWHKGCTIELILTMTMRLLQGAT